MVYSKIYTNLMARADIKPSLLNNPLLFYTYDIQDEDTPEIVAYKYYGDAYRYWIVLYCNQIMDPQWDWPLSRKNFDDYLNSNYNDIELNHTVHHFEKIITQYDENTLTTTTNTIIIDELDYAELHETTEQFNLPTGRVTVTVTKKAVTFYEYELNLNESKEILKY